MATYLAARGITGDARLDSGHAWNRNELIAEDYRQLFGTPNARATPQENRDLPQAAAVPGLRDFLASTFTQPMFAAPHLLFVSLRGYAASRSAARPAASIGRAVRPS